MLQGPLSPQKTFGFVNWLLLLLDKQLGSRAEPRQFQELGTGDLLGKLEVWSKCELFEAPDHDPGMHVDCVPLPPHNISVPMFWALQFFSHCSL